jgi:hypothetical protein
MSELHDQIMNIPARTGIAISNTPALAYKEGHRDARHAAAELAISTDAEIERLRKEVEEWKVGSNAEARMGDEARSELAELRAALAQKAEPGIAQVAEACGAHAVDGLCVLPLGHNMGRADVPANHRAAPPAPAPAQCSMCKGSGVVPDGEINHYSNGELYENGPVLCIKDCPQCTGKPPS